MPAFVLQEVQLQPTPPPPPSVKAALNPLTVIGP